jgi:hypothetical protein
LLSLRGLRYLFHYLETGATTKMRPSMVAPAK